MVRHVGEKFADDARRRCVERGEGLVKAGDGSTACKQTHQGDFAPAAGREHGELFPQMWMQVERVDKVVLQRETPFNPLLAQRVPDLLWGLIVLPWQGQVEPHHSRIFCQVAQQVRLARAFVTRHGDEAGRRGEQVVGKSHALECYSNTARS